MAVLSTFDTVFMEKVFLNFLNFHKFKGRGIARKNPITNKNKWLERSFVQKIFTNQDQKIEIISALT